ncbi:MAG TPA: 7,8-didemethyl-8-hydroxy-5-deazariboflavin synthase CofG [Dehalococcoidia bacterium]|nr:7,8-didemethyl-8-hydroxy-5-deazariboflavin synthase CofG [Dehalococcoidia bacterium]
MAITRQLSPVVEPAAARPPASRSDSPATEAVIARVLDRGRATAEEAYGLIRAPAAEVPALMLAASALRDRYRPRVVTYSRKVFIPLTNLCRDICGYCTFVRQPDDPQAHTMAPEEVLAVARAARRAGCKEALFSLGDKPEAKYPSYRRWLKQRGYASTLHYLRDMCDLVYRETGLLPHVNPGLMTEEDIAALREVSVSMGIMLETVSDRILRPGQAHHRCPDKVPKRRLATIEAAGRQRVAFTTGILIGIGETAEERVDSLFAIRELHEHYGHVQEVIVQNFRAKPDIPMRDQPEPTLLDMLRTIAVARLILGGGMNLQAPPNLAGDSYQLYLLAGINDWGGVSPVTRDYINPERPWPQLLHLRQLSEDAGFPLRERLAIYPEYIIDNESFIPAPLRQGVNHLAGSDGLVRREDEQW